MYAWVCAGLHGCAWVCMGVSVGPANCPVRPQLFTSPGFLLGHVIGQTGLVFTPWGMPMQSGGYPGSLDCAGSECYSNSWQPWPCAVPEPWQCVRPEPWPDARRLPLWLQLPIELRARGQPINGQQGNGQLGNGSLSNGLLSAPINGLPSNAQMSKALRCCPQPGVAGD
eukprot:58026-Chlamydomonas_euryale.AAC.4